MSMTSIGTLSCCVCLRRGWGKLAPFSLAACLPLLQWMLGPISSGCVNPARAFGVAFVTGCGQLKRVRGSGCDPCIPAGP